MKIFIGIILTLIFISLASIGGYLAYNIYFNDHTQRNYQNSKDTQQKQGEESYQNNDDNITQSPEDKSVEKNESTQQNGVVNNGKPGRVNNLHDTQKAYALMSVPRQDLPEDQKVIYDGVISTAMQNINNGVGNAEDYKIKEIYDGIQSVQPK